MKMKIWLMWIMMVCSCLASDPMTHVGFFSGGSASITRNVRGDLTQPPPAGAVEQMKCGRKVYPNVVFGPLRDGKVFVSYKDGSEWIAAEDLPREVQQRYRLDPKKMAELKEQKLAANRAKKQAAREAAAAEPIQHFEGTVTQVSPGGLLINANDGINLEARDIFVIAHPKQNTVIDGESLKFSAERSGRYSYKTVLGDTRTIEQWRYVDPASSPR